MKNKIIIALVAVVAWLGQSCETDPAFDFKDDGKIYFKYPKKNKRFRNRNRSVGG